MRIADQQKPSVWRVSAGFVVALSIGAPFAPRIQAQNEQRTFVAEPPVDRSSRTPYDALTLERRSNALQAVRNTGAWGILSDPNSAYNFISFRGAKVSNEALRKLATLRELRRLDFSESTITDDGLALLRQLQELEELDLSETAITDAGLGHLSGLTELKTLILADTRITGRGISVLPALKKLAHIDLSGTDVDDPGLEVLCAVRSLARLRLDGTKIGDLGLQLLLRHQTIHLTGLSLRDTRVTDRGLAQLQCLPDLETLLLTHTKVGDMGVQEIASLKRIRVLDVANTRVGDAAAATIGQWTDMAVLDLSRTHLTELGLKRLLALSNLVWLNLAGTQVTDRSLQAIAARDRLETLDLANTSVSDAGLTFLTPLASLRQLNLSGTLIADPRLEPLKALPRLESVDVGDTQLTAFDVLRAVPRTSANVRRILAALDETTELDFDERPVSDIVDYLKARHDIEIRFDGTSMAEADVQSETPVTAKMNGVTLRDALDAIIEPLGLTTSVRHEVLWIATKPLPDRISDLPVVRDGDRLSPRIARAMTQPCHINVVDRPLSGVIEDLSQRHGIDIQLDAKSLADSGVAVDMAICQIIRGVTLKSGLELLLDDLDLTCVAEGEKLVVRGKRDL